MGSGFRVYGLRFRCSSSLQVDRIWLWIYSNTIPIYPIFYLLKGDYRVRVSVFSVDPRSLPWASSCFLGPNSGSLVG